MSIGEDLVVHEVIGMLEVVCEKGEGRSQH